MPFSDPGRRIKALVMLAYGGSFTNATVNHNGWGCESDLWNSVFTNERFTTLDSVQFSEGLTILSEDGRIEGVDVGLFSPPADENGNVTFNVILEFSPTFGNQLTVRFNESYGAPLAFTFTCYYFDDVIAQFSGGAEQYVFTYPLSSGSVVNKITISITKTLPHRRLNITEISLRGGVVFEENRIASINVVEEILPRGYGTIAEKQVEVEFRNEDNMFGEAYIPEWARQDATLSVKIYTDDEAIEFKELVPISFVARKNRTAKLVATDRIRKLKEPIYAFASLNSTLAEIVSVTCQYYGLPYSVPDEFSEIVVPVPVLGQTGYDVLCNVASASNTVCFCDRNGVIRFETLEAGDTYSLQQVHVLSSARELSNRYVYNVVRVAYHNVTIDETTTIVSETLSIQGTVDLIFEFGGAYTDIQVAVAGANVIEQQLGNFGAQLKLQGSGTANITIMGNPIKMRATFVQLQDSNSIMQFGRKTVIIRNPFIQSEALAYAVAEGVLGTYPTRARLTNLKTVHPYNIKVNDIIEFGDARYVVRHMKLALKRGLSSDLECWKRV